MSGAHPMRPIEFLVLAVLSEQHRHGYGIVQELHRRTNGRVQVKPGNLYRVLDRLMERGQLEQDDELPAAELDNNRRRYYRITDAGRQALATEASLLGSFVDQLRDALPGEAS